MTEISSDIRDLYAMHFGWHGSQQELDQTLDLLADTLASAGVPNTEAFADGDNFFEWGEPLLDVDEALARYRCGALTAAQSLASVARHFVIHVPKGIYPTLVWKVIEVVMEDAPILPSTSLDELWGNSGSYMQAAFRHGGTALPFTVDDAETWGEDLNVAWEVSL